MLYPVMSDKFRLRRLIFRRDANPIKNYERFLSIVPLIVQSPSVFAPYAHIPFYSELRPGVALAVIHYRLCRRSKNRFGLTVTPRGYTWNECTR